MQTHRHLFERMCGLDNLLAAAHEALRGKRQRGPGFRFWVELESEICNLHDELMAGEYRHGAYRYFTIHEPKDRLVAAAPFRDRVVHHAIVRVIEPLFEPRFIEDSFACRRGKGTHAAMRRARQFARRFPYALTRPDGRNQRGRHGFLASGGCKPAVSDRAIITIEAQ